MSNISEYYKLLQVNEKSSNEQISRSYKKLALLYHPDRNPDRREWAHEAMTRINIAYAAVMEHRFSEKERTPAPEQGPQPVRPAAPKKAAPARDRSQEIFNHEAAVSRFIKYRESAKDALYRFFQYNLYNLHRRETPANRSIFDSIVLSLRRSYHSIKELHDFTKDPDALKHFDVFMKMIFYFYRASECLNIIDSYQNQFDVDAYRLYRRGDEYLHAAEKELFFDRHNRGHFKASLAYGNILKAEESFRVALRRYAGSTWAVETRIKNEYAASLRAYMELFFSDDE